MEVTIARYVGFCPGVRRAIRMAEETLEKVGGKVYTLGPIIHNPQVVDSLRSRGLEILPDNVEELQDYNLAGTSVVVRSHGIPPKITEFLLDKEVRLIDATCPTVKKAQRAAMRLVGEGYKLFIIGNAAHPEVKAILGHINGEAVVIKETKELKEWWGSHYNSRVHKVGMIAQTTVDLLMFRSLVDGLVNEVPELVREVQEIKIINTLCRNTLARQAEALQMALSCDFVLVMGGRNSSNTEFLRRICEIAGASVDKVERAEEVDLSRLAEVQTIAILGGASTPRYVVEEARQRLLS
jgi:(E)-4-hydroxy-3-methyl-but-2-enyl pyrophosphate reductase